MIMPAQTPFMTPATRTLLAPTYCDLTGEEDENAMHPVRTLVDFAVSLSFVSRQTSIRLQHIFRSCWRALSASHSDATKG
jgi:hypothetical protein